MMKNNHRLANIERVVANHEQIIRRLDSGMAEMREMQSEYATAMVKVNAELVKVNQRLDAHMLVSEKQFRMFYDRIVKLEHKNGKNGKRG